MRYRKIQSVKSADYVMVLIILFGLLILLCEICFRNVRPFNVTYCHLNEWLHLLSFTVVFVTIVVKTYRIARIFSSQDGMRKAKPPSKVYLYGIILASTIIVSTFYLAIGLKIPYVRQLVPIQSSTAIGELCYQKRISIVIVTRIYQVFVLILGIVYSILGRHAWKAFNESHSNALVIYNFLASILLISVLDFSTNLTKCTVDLMKSTILIYNAYVILSFTMFYKIKNRNVDLLSQDSQPMSRASSTHQDNEKSTPVPYHRASSRRFGSTVSSKSAGSTHRSKKDSDTVPSVPPVPQIPIHLSKEIFDESLYSTRKEPPDSLPET